MNLHLFIAGTGGVGKALMTQIGQKRHFLMQTKGINLIINGIINSRRMKLSQEGIPIEEFFTQESKWIEADLSEFIRFIQQLRIHDAVFVDVTASASVAATYLELLQNGIHVVACNKIACAAPLAHYSRLKAASQEHGASFLYNTNVGAALPYLQSLRQLYLAGERIDRIEAVLSGTLSYIFGSYDGTRPFAHIVREAHQAGYTEPDPRIDLQGMDVMRKLLILCREIDIPLEEKDIVKTSFLPESCLKGSLDDFYNALLSQEEYFKQRLEEAQAQGAQLKYMASWEQGAASTGAASIGLHAVLPQHPLFNLSPKDNILLIYSENYLSPLSISGAGAGAQGTAMGVLSDIISV